MLNYSSKMFISVYNSSLKLEFGLKPASIVDKEMQPTLLPLTRQSDRANTSGGMLLSSLFETSIPFKLGKALIEGLQVQ